MTKFEVLSASKPKLADNLSCSVASRLLILHDGHCFTALVPIKSFEMSRSSLGSLLCLVFFLPALADGELIVTKRQIGWDSQLRPLQFNPICIVVKNAGTQPWKGEVHLKNRDGQNFPLIEADLFVEPGGERTLRYMTYHRSTNEYYLEWIDDGQPKSMKLTDAGEDMYVVKETTEPAIVQMAGSRGVSHGAGTVLLETEFFPLSVAGMAGLQAVVLDEVPDLQPAQQRAFLDWVYQGGELHIFGNSAAEPLTFPDTMTDLNQPFDEFDVGAGRVVRHAESLRDANQAFIRRVIRQPKTGTPTPDNANNFYGSPPDTTILMSLQSLTKPDHNWVLIYTLAIIYLLLIFPGGYLLGRFWGDYRLTYGGLIGVVILFSLAFDAVGRRGYGEVTSYNYVAIAHPASEGHVQVTQLGNLFATQGGMYQIRHNAEDCVYADGQGNSIGRRDVAVNPPFSLVDVDIPAFSDRPLIHGGVVKKGISKLVVVDSQFDGNSLTQLTLKPEQPDQWPANIEGGLIVYGDQAAQIRPQADGTLSLSPSWNSLLSHYSQQTYYSNNNAAVDEVVAFQQLIGRVMAFDLGLNGQKDFDQFKLQHGRARIYLQCPGSDEFGIQLDSSPKQSGRVVYVLQLTLPAPSQASAPDSTDQPETPE